VTRVEKTDTGTPQSLPVLLPHMLGTLQKAQSWTESRKVPHSNGPVSCKHRTDNTLSPRGRETPSTENMVHPGHAGTIPTLPNSLQGYTPSLVSLLDCAPSSCGSFREAPAAAQLC